MDDIINFFGSAIPCGPKGERPTASGHRFGPELDCQECGRMWDDHQREPSICTASGAETVEYLNISAPKSSHASAAVQKSAAEPATKIDATPKQTDATPKQTDATPNQIDGPVQLDNAVQAATPIQTTTPDVVAVHATPVSEALAS